MLKKLLLFVSFLCVFSPLSQAATYSLDADHTTIEFKIRHLFSWTKGTFDEYEGSFVFEEGNPDSWNAEVTIQAGSINTRNKSRDKHLKSKDFFDVETFPTLTFKSTSVTEANDSSFKLHGDLTLHGVTKPVTLNVEFHGKGMDPWGNALAGFTATTEINRKDFELNWSKTVETGQLVVGEEVMITIEVEGIKQ